MTDQEADNHNQDPNHVQAGASSQDANAAENPNADEKPIIAKLADEQDSSRFNLSKEDAAATDATTHDAAIQETVADVRVGSPFAVDPALTPSQVAAQSRKIEKFYDVGPLRYTAMGAVGASAMVILFGVVACWWFPGGGALIAALGCALAAFGLFSHLRLPAAACLVVHMSIFVISYSRLL